MLKKHFVSAIMLSAICLIVGGCTPAIPDETTEPTEQRREDIQLGVTELKLSDLEDEADEFYFQWHDGGSFGSISRIYVSDGQGWYEYYETDPFPADFLDGGTVKVTKAYANSFNSADYETFAARFTEMDGLGKIVEKAEFLEDYTNDGDMLYQAIVHYKAGEYAFLPFDYAAALKTTDPETEEGNLMALLDDIRMDRGSDITHKLVDQDE